MQVLAEWSIEWHTVAVHVNQLLTINTNQAADIPHIMKISQESVNVELECLTITVIIMQVTESIQTTHADTKSKVNCSLHNPV